MFSTCLANCVKCCWRDVEVMPGEFAVISKSLLCDCVVMLGPVLPVFSKCVQVI